MSNTVKKHLVIALWEEDPSWILSIPNHWEVFTYCKAPQRFGFHADSILWKLCEKGHFTILANHGRESHTYFNHIERYYDDLADITIFCQGKNSDHIKNLTEILEQRDLESIANVLLKQFPQNKPIVDLNKGYIGLGGFNKYNSKHDINHPFVPTTKRYMYKVWVHTYGSPEYVTPSRFSHGNCFAATSNLLRKFSKKWYQQSIEHHENDRYYGAAWAMERLFVEMLLVDDFSNYERGCKLYL